MPGPSSDVAAFRSRLESAGLERFAHALIQLARPSIRLAAAPSVAAEELAASRLGGAPDLSLETPWPRDLDSPLSFIAQVNLADVARYDVDGILPPGGLLSFFYAAVSQQAWGFDPADHGSFAVLYTPAKAGIERRQPPSDLAREGIFRALGLRPTAELTFAPWESFDVESLGMSRDESFAYADLFDGDDEMKHRLLGQPDSVQGDMQVECQLVTNGLYCGDSTGYQDPRAGELRPGAAGWRLLLQIDSEESAGMMWGDVGRLFYWIKHSDLVDRNWGLTWLVLQCG